MKLIRALSRTFSRAPPPAMMMDLSAYPADDDEDVASKRSVYDPHFMPPEGWDAWSEWAAEQGKIARIVNTLAKSIMSFLIKSHDKDCQDLCDVMTRSTHLHTELLTSARYWLIYGRVFIEPVWATTSKTALAKIRNLYPPSVMVYRNSEADIQNLKAALKDTVYEPYAASLKAGNGDTVIGYLQNYVPHNAKNESMVFFRPDELIFIPRYPSARHPNGISLPAQNYILIMNKLGMERDQAIMVKRHGDPKHKFFIPADTWDDPVSRDILKKGFKKGIRAGLDFFFRSGETNQDKMDVDLVEPKGNPAAVSKAIDHLENQFNAAMCWADSFNESGSSNRSVGYIQLAFFEREITPERRFFAEILEDQLLAPWLQANGYAPDDAWFEFEDLTPEDRLQKAAIIAPLLPYLPAGVAEKFLEDMGYPIDGAGGTPAAAPEQTPYYSLKGVPQPVSRGTRPVRDQLRQEIEDIAEEVRDVLGY